MSQGHMFHREQGEDTHISEHIEWLCVRGHIVESYPLCPAGQGRSETIVGCSWDPGSGRRRVERAERRANEYIG